jgi:hypothetical protein
MQSGGGGERDDGLIVKQRKTTVVNNSTKNETSGITTKFLSLFKSKPVFLRRFKKLTDQYQLHPHASENLDFSALLEKVEEDETLASWKFSDEFFKVPQKKCKKNS